MDIFSICTAAAWDMEFKKHEQENALSDLESGKIIFCPQLSFNIEAAERMLFIPYLINKKTKNISYNLKDNRLKGIKADQKHHVRLKSMLARFSKQANYFMGSLFSHYTNSLAIGRTSYRPVQIRNRKTSARKDDRRLHVDAFAANPNQGKRIVRLFCNINPYGEHRVWRVGESFEEVAQRFLPKINKPIPGSAKLLHWLGITKSIRTHYDHIMLKIHDGMKLDADYQKQVKYKEISFPPGTSWIVSTDQVSHAAISGQYLLEQTFYLPILAMANPQTAPLHILEGLAGYCLI
ncbi:MAG: Kdo hydroxylase family protein [Candidatus Aquirickettsiella sp.]